MRTGTRLKTLCIYTKMLQQSGKSRLNELISKK